MESRYDLLFETARFNLSKPKPYFVNESCYGDDLAVWLRGKLDESGLPTTEPGQEDWGWYFEIHDSDHVYHVGISGNADDEQSGDQGEWRLMVEKGRSLGEKLRGTNLMAENEGILAVLKGILENEPDITFLGIQ